MGVSLFPNTNAAKMSTTNNIECILNSKQSFNSKLENAAHELYGHVYLYLISGGDMKRACHQFEDHLDDNMYQHDSNTELYKRIRSATKEVKQYMK